MAVKEAEKVSPNGHVSTMPTSRKMSAFQQKYMKRLAGNFDRAKAGVQQAQDAANEFITACAEEEGIALGMDGWTFDLDNLEFVKVPQLDGPSDDGEERGGNGDNS